MERLELVKAQKPKQVVLGTDVKSKGKPFIFKAAAGTKGTMVSFSELFNRRK